ncbi:hypothetical protein MLD38_007285 [Melastoma candidum]|uniref:Uncharacterized protein n=1 Tax=Melastoma candidum TaxID=119954 RepID=A0ACB9RUD3_9MYRT|nr:hypothetical protein MLD38_007285 [Melastoma candidum]
MDCPPRSHSSSFLPTTFPWYVYQSDPQDQIDFIVVLELMILLPVAAPEFIVVTLKDGWLSGIMCLLIGCYLLQEHIPATGGVHHLIMEPHGTQPG